MFGSQFRRAVRAFFSAARVWLVLILLLAWGLRLYHLDSMSLWWDESLTWDRATNTLPNILNNTIMIQNVATRDLHPPLYFLLLHFFVLAAGVTEFALRFLSAGANLLTLAMLYPLTRLLVKSRFVALLAVFFAALSPFYVWYAQEARPYALVLLWSVLAIYALLRWLRGLRTNPQTWRAFLSRWFLVFGVAFFLTLTTHYLSFVLLPLFAATLLIFGNCARSWRARFFSPLTLFAALLLVAFGAILFVLPRSDQDLASWDQVGAHFVPFVIMLRDVWNSFAVGVTAILDQVVLLDLFLLALWLVGIFSTIRVKARNARVALFLLCYLLLPALALQLGSYLRPLYLNSRHLITTSPAFYIGLALGINALAQRIAAYGRQTADDSQTTDDRPQTTTSKLQHAVRRPPSVVIFTILVILLCLPIVAGAAYALHNLYFDATYAKDNHKAWAQYLRERMRPDDYLLLVAPQAEKIVQYYLPAKLRWESLPHLGQTRDWQTFLDRESVLNAYRHSGRVWFLEIHQPVGDPKHVINNLLRRYGDPTELVEFPAIASQIVLTQFLYRGVELPNDAVAPHPLDVTFGDTLRLLGYDAPRQMEAGTRAAVKLYWRLMKKTPHDVSISLRVTDENGRVWGQWDAPPIGNLYPLSSWRRKRIYLGAQDLVIDPGAPPGTYNIELAVYRAANHEPLAAKAMDGLELETVHLGKLQVTRPAAPIDPRALVIDRHMNTQFGDTVRFVGFDYEPQVSPGGTIPLALYFQVLDNSALESSDRTLAGEIEFAAPWWQFWNRTRAAVPFTLDLNDRQPGDIAQAKVDARVPGEANAGLYELRLTFDNAAPQNNFGGALTFAEVQVEPLERSTAMPGIENNLRARLGDSVELLGYALDASQPLHPGDTVKLKLYWRALKPMDTSFKVFTHLVNAQNEIFGQQDQEPLGGARPTTSWAPGEIFTDEYEFQVAANAAPGAYQIEIGMYHPTAFTRLPAFDANGNPTGDRILFGSLQIR